MMKSKQNQSKRLARWSRCIASAMLILFAFATKAQTVPITGTVTDASTGISIPGASVYIKGTQNGTSTDIDGRFSLNANTGDKTLVVSFVGYKAREIEIVGTTFKIELEPESTDIEEVVVVGYGIQKTSDVTSSAATVKSDKFVQGATKDAAQLIQGKVAGLSVSTSTGDPTAGTQIMLRGISTLMSSPSPLVIVDGVPGSLSSVAPEDIASIDVLKDGSAAAIYGTRGNNGVIFITTKRAGKDMPSTIEYSSYYSTQMIARKLDFLTASEYRKKIAEGVTGFEDLGGSTDWLKEITRTPFSHTQNITLKGGNSTSTYTATINYRQQEGLFKRSDNEQLIGRLNLTHSMFDNKLKFELSLSSRNMEYWAGADGYSFNQEIYRQAIIRNPTDVIKDNTGKWQERDTYMYNNPVALLNEANGKNKDKETRYSGSVILTPISDLNMKLLVSRVENSAIRGYYETKQHISTTKYGKNGYASRSTYGSFDNLLELTTDYTKTIGKHKASVLGGYSYEYEEYEQFWMQNWDFPTDLYSYNNMASGDALMRGEAKIGSSKNSSTLVGFFGRFNYNYDNKYLVMASIRREGSSKFGDNYKWGSFPAVSVGWRISNEPFMNTLSFIKDLKLRAGFGITGTIPNDPYLSQISLGYDTDDRFLYNGVWIQGIKPTRNYNPDLRWEKKEEINVGVDFSILEGIVSGNIDLYKRTTKDMLYNYPVPVPPNFVTTTTANAAKMENKGIEVFVQATPVKTSLFNWNTSFTYSYNKNELVSLSSGKYKTTNDYFDEGYTGEPIQTVTHRVQVGNPIGNFWGYKSIGVDNDGQWIIACPDGTTKSVVDVTEADKQVLGNGLPKFYIGFNNTFQYKNFDLSVNLRGAFGFKVLNFSRMYYENAHDKAYNKLASAFDKVYGKELKSDLYYVSHYLEKGDYIKLDNVTLGYTFDVKESKIVKNARVYVSALNLLTITKYKGIDPEVNRSGLAPGNDERDKYPTTRTFSFGVNVTF